MNTKPNQPTQAPSEDPNTDPAEQPQKPSKPAPRRKFILPTFTATGPAIKHLDYRTFLNDSGIRRF